MFPVSNNPQKRTAIKLHYINYRGKHVKLNKRSKIQVYYSVGRGKKLIKLGRTNKKRFKNAGDYVTALKDRARQDDLKRNAVKTTKEMTVPVWTGSYKVPAHAQKKKLIYIPYKLTKVISKKSSRRKDIFDFKAETKYNQKYLFENLKFNKYLGKRYKKVGVFLIMKFFNKQSNQEQTIKIKLKDIKKHIKGFTKGWTNAIAKSGITMTNYLYYALLNSLKGKFSHFSPKARRFNGVNKRSGKKDTIDYQTIKGYSAHIEFTYTK